MREWQALDAIAIARVVRPDVVCFQTDIGSQPKMRRSREWISAFEKACANIGASGSTAYMYDLALWMYTEPPPVRVTVGKGSSVLLVFQKCVDPKTAADANRFQITDVKGQQANESTQVLRLTAR